MKQTNTTPTTPIINLGGTGAVQLIEQYDHATRAVMLALGALKHATPHGRDYPAKLGRINGDEYTAALKEHEARCNALRAVYKELAAITHSLYEQHQVSCRATQAQPERMSPEDQIRFDRFGK